jgi:hypothetical protein
MELTPGQWVFFFATLVFMSFAFSYRMRRTGPDLLRQRLRRIMIPELTLEGATIAQALEILNEAAVKHDQQGMGVPFTTTIHTDEVVTVAFERQSLWDGLEGISLLYSLYYHIEDDAHSVELYLPNGDEDPIVREYRPSGERYPRPWAIDFESEFKGIGLEFPDDGYARYTKRLLSVRANENTLNLIEKMFELDPIPSDPAG